MCSHYNPLIHPLRLADHFGVSDLPLDLKPSLWPGYLGPFVRLHPFTEVGDAGIPERELLVGSFGLIPHWSKDTTIARHTYNARTETVHEKPSHLGASPQGETLHSYTVLTINADSHPLMRQFHKPEDEKRMVVILNEADYGAWLTAGEVERRNLLAPFPVDLLVAEAPQASLL